jgi:SAM-dependent methyltransferase
MDAQYAAAYPELYKRTGGGASERKSCSGKIAVVLEGVSEARILDVGCGAGLFFDALEPFGLVEGVESDRAAVEARGKSRSRIVFAVSVVLPKLLVRAIDALAPRPPRVPRLAQALTNRALCAWFRAEGRMAGWLPFGGSVLAVAARA